MLFLLILTIFIIYKLYKILGQESDMDFFSKKRNIKDITATVDTETKDNKDIFDGFQYLADDQKNIIKNIKNINSAFDLNKFIKIAEQIHEVLLESFSLKNTDKIETLLSKELLEKIKKDISEAPEDLLVNVIKINEIKYSNIYDNLEEYFIEIYIDSQQNIKIDNEIEKLDIREILIFSCNKKTNLSKWCLFNIKECE